VYRKLLVEIQADIAELSSLQELLQGISPTAPALVQVAGESIKQVEQTITDQPEMEKVTLEGVRKTITDASGLLGMVLENAKNLAGKAVETGKVIAPVIEKLGPLLDRISIAALWAAKLWLN
jgi:phage-related tail protein